MHQVIQGQLGNITSGGVKVDLAIKVSAKVVGVGQQLPVGAIWSKPFKILYLEGFIGRPGGSSDSQRDGQIK